MRPAREPRPQRAHRQLRVAAIGFRDLFSQQAAAYAAARPGYPDELFEYLGTLAPRRSTVWDCATGNGQAATSLARHFDRVVATDASAEQIARAVPGDGIEYRVAPADRSGLADHSIALVTVAQALHWFDFDSFYTEVRRVTVHGGVIAVWSYGACHAGNDLETELRDFQEGTVGLYWDPARRWVDEEYRTIPFPFAVLKAPAFELHKQWSLTQLGGYLRSWSAVAKYVKERGEDPVIPLLERLANRWGSADERRRVRWPLALRVGRIE